MKFRNNFAGFIAVLILLIVNSTVAFAFPPAPASFFGTVKDGGANVPEGTPVQAWIDGAEYGATTVIIDGGSGDSVYTMNVVGDDTDTPEKDGGEAGDTIIFYVDGRQAPQTAEWQSGTNVELNLTYDPTVVSLTSLRAAASGVPGAVFISTALIIIGLTLGLLVYRKNKQGAP
jgi:hypothetical protein